jgi:hypothetical protein
VNAVIENETPERTRSGPWGFVVLGTTLVASLLAPLQVNDLAYQLRVGQWMWAAHHVARTDMLTYTVFGQPWLNQQWGAQLLLWLGYDAGGWKTLIVVRAALVAACFGATFRIARSAGSSSLVAGVCTLAGYVASALVPGTLTLRPQLLALPLFVTSAWLIRSRETSPRRLLILPCIAVAWANIHGSFPILTVLLAIALVHDAVTRAPTRRMTIVATISSLLAPLVSPWGFGTYRYVWQVTTSPVTRHVITEWQPLYSNVIPGLAASALLTIAAVAYAKRGVRRPTLEETLGLAVFTGLAVWSARNVLWWSVFVPPVMGGLLAGWRPGSVWTPRSTIGVTAAVALSVGLSLAFVFARPVDASLTEAPPGVTRALAVTSTDGGNVFDEWWGSWFEFALPDRLMFTDARVEIFPESVWNDYDTIVNARSGWSDVLARYGVSVIVVNSEHSLPLVDALAQDPGWVRSYEDADGVIYRRA